MLRSLSTHRTLSTLLHLTPAFPRRFAGLSTYAQPLQPEMFTRAVQEHPEPQKKPKSFLPNRTRLNAVPTVASNSPQTHGSRKPDSTPELSRSALSDLHDAVFFGENESENDDFLEIEYAVSKHTQTGSASHNSSFAEPNPRVNEGATPATAIPSSSIPIPWSSSPPREPEYPNLSQRQQKKRSLPWEDITQDNRGKPGPYSDHLAANQKGNFKRPMVNAYDGTPKPQYRPVSHAQDIKTEHTPPIKKEKQLPWDKSFSAVKEEQKELRRQMKIKSSSSIEKRLNNIPRPPNTRVPSIFFSEEQNQVIETIVKMGKSVFYTGSAGTGGKEAKFAFAAGTWNTSIQHTILLTQVFRQKDPDFANMLNEMRLGRLSPSAIQAFKDLSRPLNCGDNIEATELFPTRAEVDLANSGRMNRLSGAVMTFHAVDSGAIKDEQVRARLLSNCMAPPTIHLKKGAQVMLIKNKDETLVNGSLGTVVAFMDEAGFDNHMREGQKYDGAPNDFDEELDWGKQKIKSMAFDQKAGSGGITTAKQYPLVAFILPDGSERQLLFMVHPKVTEFYQNLSSINDINNRRKPKVQERNNSDLDDDFDSLAQYV
ncbi:DNA repair and recombination protein pif1 [Arthroderma uncinatum]|uniref:DNA repair and recombination protein pif1 n=1 Tax=Arthroderma uncinatum TaxID=74035 RepID=UPI00144A7F65|nr:DNA repair and recombination protein pif1 [Arthroderma uncinatum]KAF3483385.1 DNA repair and recombination protein pif1 [Arthroderma uncinatum]